MNNPTLSSTSTNIIVTASRGTKPPDAPMPRTSRRTTMAYTHVATKTPSESWIVRSRRNVSTRGENWLLVSCSTTMVIENTR
jgi:hypothetical protein